MKKKIYILISLLFVFLVLVPTFGFSLWYFNSFSMPTIDNKFESKVDDIEENYNFTSNHSEHKSYTIYFFPSSIYLKEYKDYIDGKTSTLPEDLFGSDAYINYSYDETSASLSSLDNGNLKQAGLNYLNYFTYTLGCDATTGLSDETITLDNENMLSYVNANYEYSKSQYSSTYGNYSVNYGSATTDSYSLTDNRDTSDGRSARFNNKFIFSRDRFGYWKGKNAAGVNITSNLGRYAPIKIEINSIFNQNFYSELPTPETSMGDGYSNTLTYNGTTYLDEWYNLEFAGWTYLTSEENKIFYDRYDYTTTSDSSYDRHFDNAGNIDFSSTTLKKSANYLLDGFKSLDVIQLFDLTQDLSKYADSNGIIRLFPIFSNGKTYDLTSKGIEYNHTYHQLNGDVSSFNDASLSHGGLASAYILDGNKKKYFLYNGNANYAVSKIYYSASSDYNKEATSWIYVSQIKNLYYDSSSSFKVYAASNKHGGSGNFLGEYNSYNTNSEVNNYLSDYMANKGEGLYNVYLFYTNQYISSLSSITSSHTTWKKTYSNGEYFDTNAHYDSYVFNADYINLHTCSDGYKGAAGRKQYNFTKSYYSSEVFVDRWECSYLNYLLQTPSETYSYYKTNFESLSNNDLDFISAASSSSEKAGSTAIGTVKSDASNGTYYGDFATNEIYEDKSGFGFNDSAYYNSQFVVAIEQIKETKVVTSENFVSSNWKTYYSLLQTSSSCYYNSSLTSDINLSSSNKIDSSKIYIAEGITLKEGDPLYLYTSSLSTSKLDISSYDSNSYEMIYMDFYNQISEGDSSSTLSNTCKYNTLSTYFDTSTMKVNSDGTYNFVFYLNEDNEYEVYVYKHKENFIKIFINDEYKTHSRSKTSNYFVDSYSTWGLLWEYNGTWDEDNPFTFKQDTPCTTRYKVNGTYDSVSSDSTIDTIGTKNTLIGLLAYNKDVFSNYLNKTFNLIDNSTGEIITSFTTPSKDNTVYWVKISLSFSLTLKKNHIFYLELAE